MKRLARTILSAASVLAGFFAIQLNGCTKPTDTKTPEAGSSNSAQNQDNNTVPSEPGTQNPEPELKDDRIIREYQNDEPITTIYGPPEMFEPSPDNQDVRPDINNYKDNGDFGNEIYGPPEWFESPKGEPDAEPVTTIYGPPEMLDPEPPSKTDDKAKKDDNPKKDKKKDKDKKKEDSIAPYKAIERGVPGEVRALYGVVSPRVNTDK